MQHITVIEPTSEWSTYGTFRIDEVSGELLVYINGEPEEAIGWLPHQFVGLRVEDWEGEDAMNKRMTFEEWLSAVNTLILRATGLDRDDLPDWRYADAYTEGVSPASAARQVVRAARDF